jgi:hypothetical protein
MNPESTTVTYAIGIYSQGIINLSHRDNQSKCLASPYMLPDWERRCENEEPYRLIVIIYLPLRAITLHQSHK